MVLDAILDAVQHRLEQRQQQVPLARVERAARDAPAPRGFAAALTRAPGGIGLIAELKKASPSVGVIRSAFDVADLGRALVAGGADCLSVLTETDSFLGSLPNLQTAGEAGVPRLQKDFILSEYQLLEGRAAGADAVLLIAEVLSPQRAKELLSLALDLGLDVLFEAHAPDNVRRVASAAERQPERILVGVNNRDLRSFETHLEVTLRALHELPHGLQVVSESGITGPEQVHLLREAGTAAILVGEHLMRQEDVTSACQALLAAVR